MNVFISSIVMLVGYVLQTTLIDKIAIFGIKPNLLLVILICYTVQSGRERGAIAALFVGMFIDLLSGRIFGINTILYIVIVVVCWLCFDTVFSHNLATVLVSVAGLSVLFGILYHIALFFTGTHYPFGYSLVRIILPETLYNVIVTVPVYWVIYRIFSKINVA